MEQITASDVKRLLLRNYRRFSNGEISESKAMKENVLLGGILKAIEISETEERLSRIEEALRLSINDNYEYGEKEDQRTY